MAGGWNDSRNELGERLKALGDRLSRLSCDVLGDHLEDVPAERDCVCHKLVDGGNGPTLVERHTRPARKRRIALGIHVIEALRLPLVDWIQTQSGARTD